MEGYIDELAPDQAIRAYDLVSTATALWANQLIQGHIDVAEAINANLITRFRPGGVAHSLVTAAGGALARFFRGDYERAAAMLEDMNRLNRDFQLPGRNSMPNDPLATGYAHLSYVRSVAGDLAEARAVSDEGLLLAEGAPFPVGPFTVCYLLGMRASVELAHEEFVEADRFATRQAELAERHGFTFWSLMSGVYRANVEFSAGDAAASQRASMAVMMLRALGLLVWVPSFLAAIAAVHLARGEGAEAATLLEEAAEVAAQTGAHYWSAEIARQRGEAALLLGDQGGIDRLREAIALAVAQAAPLHELWARTSLCRHSDDPSNREALGKLLEHIPLAPDAPSRRAAEAALGGGALA